MPPSDKPVERWFVHGKVVGQRGTVNCPTVMNDPERKTFPQRWEDVPSLVYDPIERLKALDRDGVDGEVLFPNDPVQSGTFFQGDAEFELACVQAYNDGLAEWRETSDRFVSSQRKRKLDEEIFGWLKQFGGLRRARVTGRWKIQQLADLALATLNLVRMRSLLRA